ncbi:polyisoprenyl-phosphate glycosyltransferase [Candidatus Gastranaerophilus sp. (ex Termes propinquus)]|nr:polyisoprenyl-phosphate glycosyltransferase [Candidatus Gastranaerophilus sp. (ex Termes propinquus)]
MNSEKPCKLGIVIPCYNEEEVLADTLDTLLALLDGLGQQNIVSPDSFIYLVDDGSVDGTFGTIQEFHLTDSRVKALRFTRNFGNQNALLGGLEGARALNPDCVITMDADLQQDETVIKDFIEKFNKGNEIVFGIRTTTKSVGFFKKFTSKVFYKFMNLLGAKVVPNHSEYRLMSKKALDILAQYGEYSLFLRGLFNHIGLKRSTVKFTAKPRMGGRTKFNWCSLTMLALSGITSFSIAPLRLVVILGILMSLISFGVGINVLFEKFILQNTIPGWATIVVCTCFFSGVQIFCLGIIGEYLGQIFNEVKARPRYIKDLELV